ncbi:hypothetical protein FG386_001227 [Cryptosporidium ryanae]|uniref:uncharacterized protein n=1 Tax=Cryptosporidium ryanae TaxID=515981 RepID=UPI00351A3834|nr:hypothetical protein FG386_001227 [Cryptosporidium ryanae]
MKIIRFNTIILVLLQIFKGYFVWADQYSKNSKNTVFRKKYKFSADELLSVEFPARKFRDLKRKSRVEIEVNNKILHIWEDSIKNSELVLNYLYTSNDNSFLYDEFPFASLIPPKLLNLLVKIVNGMIENLPPYIQNTYFEDGTNEVLNSYKVAYERERRNYKNVIIRAACRLVIVSVLLSSYENLENREHSILVGLKYPFLDDVEIKGKSTFSSNLNDMLNMFIDSLKSFGNRIKSGIIKSVKLDNSEDKYDAIEMFEANTEQFLSKISQQKISSKVSLFGEDEKLYSKYPMVINVMKIYMGKQERIAMNIFDLFEKTIQKYSSDLFNVNEIDTKSIVICRDRQLVDLLPIGMKFRSCIQTFTVILKLYSGHYYKKRKVKQGRKNVLKKIIKMACIRLIQVS